MKHSPDPSDPAAPAKARRGVTSNTPFRLDSETKQKLRLLAAARNETMTAAVRRLIWQAQIEAPEEEE